MTDKCPYCGKEFTNTKALGSHVHYLHENTPAQGDRTEEDKQRFDRLLESCLSDRKLFKPREVEKIERAINEIPPGVSPILDAYRDAFSCATTKEKLVKEVEKLLQKEEDNKQK